MEQKQNATNARQRLMQSILDLGNKAFHPDATEESRQEGQREFDEFLQRTKTINLIGAFNILIRPGYTPPWLRTKLVELLTLMPLRPDGVRATLEFVFSVHPSSTIKLSEAAVPQKKGANITHEALEMASRLISTPPATVGPDKWYAGISPQLLGLLDGGEGPELMKVVSYIIGFGILGRKASGAPGTAGWKFLAEPMLQRIKPPAEGLSDSQEDDSDVIDLSIEMVLVSPGDLATAIRRLHSLVVSHPNPGLCKRLLAPLLLPLWALSSWQGSKPGEDKVPSTSSELLKIFLKLSSSSNTLLVLVHNLSYAGGYDKQNPEWIYAETDRGEIQVVKTRHIGASASEPRPLALDQIQQKVTKVMDLVASSFSDADISTAFIDLLGRWLKSSQNYRRGEVIIQESSTNDDPVEQLTEVKLLQSMMEKFPEKLASQPKHILELASQVLADTGTEDDEVIEVALSLLNMVITVPGFQKSRADTTIIERIESALDALSRRENPEISRTAANLGMLLRFRDQIEEASDIGSAPTDRQVEDRKTYNLAISYITQADSPPPVKFEGLNLLSGLITSQSPILDIPGTLVLLSTLIADGEDYINLQVIKLYTLLAGKHPKAVTKELLDHYVDPNETATVDTRLRFGEALLQVIERLGETFTGDAAQQVGDALVSVAGRRGHRPKTEARQAREEEARRRKHKEAEDAWDGEVPDLSDDMTEEERARNEILARIVEGWESKRGTEDVRIRASALSVLGSAIETNIAGLGPALISTAVDLAVNILQLEREEEKGILRRAAVLLVLSFVKALNGARQVGRKLGFGLAAREDISRTLGYVAETDVDGLVREHARDVMESLENWEITRLTAEGVREVESGSPDLTRLVGLEVNPEGVGKGKGATTRPRIEEIE